MLLLSLKDVETKINLANSNDKLEEAGEMHNAIASRVLSYLSADESVTKGSVVNRIRIKSVTKEQIEAVVDALIEKNIIKAEETEFGKGGRKTIRLKLAK